MICSSWGSKSRLAKAAGAEPAGQMRDEKLHAVVARSTFRSQNEQNTPAPDHFWALRCQKSARRCGAKHISTSKCTKHTRSGPLLGVEMSKKCTPLWREAHLQVKKVKTPHVRTTFGSWDVEKVHAVVARSTLASEKGKNTSRSDHFWKLRFRKSARRCGAKHISKSKWTKHTSSGPLLEVAMSKKCMPLWREAHFEVNMWKHHIVRATFGRSGVVSHGRRKGLCTLSKVSKTWGFCSISKNDGRRGAFLWTGPAKMHFSVAGAVQETCSSELLGGPGADFLRGVAFWSLRSSGLLRWFCVTGAALRMTWLHFFVAGAVL